MAMIRKTESIAETAAEARRLRQQKEKRRRLKPGRSGSRLREAWTAALFLAPSVLGFALFFFVPFWVGFGYSLRDSPIGGSYVGLSNYAELLANEAFLRALRNTLRFTVIGVPLNMALSLLLALWLNQSIYLRGWIRIGFLTPLVIPVASVVLVWRVIFENNGALNGWLESFGFQSTDWMNTGNAFWVVVTVYLWKNIGYNMILFLAGLQTIPAPYYEAAAIDGAGKFKQFRSITLVYLTPSAYFVLVISIVNSFKVFRETYMIAGNYPHESIYMLQHYMNNLFYALDYQKLTAAAFLMTGSMIVMVIVLFGAQRKFIESIR